MKIYAIASALPEWEVDNPTIMTWSGLEEKLLQEKIGVHRRRFLKHNETGLDLAERACLNLRAAHPLLDWKALGCILYVTQNPELRMPHNAALLQHRLGIPTNCATFDISLGCSGYVYAISLAESFMRAQNIENGLVITSDPYSKAMLKNNREVIGLFGDAATATWMSSKGEWSIGKGDWGTDGSGASYLCTKGGGAANPISHFDDAEVLPVSAGESSISMNGRAIFNFVVARVPESIDRCLTRNGLVREDVDLFLFHQASRFVLETLINRMRLPAERVPIRLQEVGNTVSSTIPLLMEETLLKNDDKVKRVCLCGFGVGLSWASNILTKEEVSS